MSSLTASETDQLAHPMSTSDRAAEIYQQEQAAIHARTDRLFSFLMIGQYLAGIFAAIWISPRTWSGAMSETHVHVWAAIGLGGAITSIPVFLAWRHSGRRSTRHVIAIGQMLTSALLIHLTGGRIETHFHIFGSLAFLSCYRDWRVLATATFIVTVDHGMRGYWWPESVYGVLSGASLRFIEHSGWIVFENIFLSVTIFQNIADMKRNARHQAALESTNLRIESEVQRRTLELQDSMTATAQANAQLENANEALQQKNEELDQFTYVASHDLQEPVRKLVSFTRLLEEDIDGDLNENAKNDLTFIVDAANRMRDLIQALLELSRAGRSAMKSESVRLEDCVDRSIDALSLAISDSKAKIEREALPTVMGDPMMLTQLYQNLISNALKFTRDREPVIRITAQRDGDRWILKVSDNGIGMNARHIDRIFQPFQRLHSRSEFAGTGIGLSICKKTINRHRGEIWVESVEGEGTDFLFSLPVAANDQPSATDADNKTTNTQAFPLVSISTTYAAGPTGTKA